MGARDLVRPIEIEHLRELQAALKAADGESQKQIRVVFNQAADVVAGGARRRLPVRSGRARGSIKPLSQQRLAKVVAGSGRVPYYGFLDFGNAPGRGRGVGRGDTHPRRFVPGGRYLYPSWDANRRSILDAMAAGIVAVAETAGLRVT